MIRSYPNESLDQFIKMVERYLQENECIKITKIRITPPALNRMMSDRYDGKTSYGHRHLVLQMPCGAINVEVDPRLATRFRDWEFDTELDQEKLDAITERALLS